MKKLSQITERYFSLLIILFAALGLLQPSWADFWTEQLKYLLGIVIFAMALTLSFADFQKVLAKPMFVGVALQYFLMPGLAFAVAKVLNLPDEFAIGLVLVGSCPGGTVSNVMVYIARADLPLSVLMTFVSTLIAPVMIPLMMWIYASQWVQVDAQALFLTSIKIVLLPLLLGLLVNLFAKNKIETIKPLVSLIAIFVVCFIIFIMVAVNMEKILGMQNLLANLLWIFAAVILHNFLGLCTGYFMAKKFPELERDQWRSISIEVGIQNSGLASVLALLYFGPLAVVPAVLSASWHSISGSLLVNHWKNN